MANFEALIKQALNTQNSADPIVREKIYNSSRNALRRMLEKAPNQTAEGINAHMRNLEQTIIKIETGYDTQQAVAQKPAPVEPAAQISEPTPSLIAEPRVQAPPQPQSADASLVSPEPTVQAPQPAVEPEPLLAQSFEEPQYVGVDEPYESVEVPPPLDDRPQYKRSNPFLRRIWWVLFIVAGLLVALWLLYALSAKLGGGIASSGKSVATQQSTQVRRDENSTYITLLSADERGALLTEGRGTAEIVTELNAQLLRIQSIRQNVSSDIADPILLELQPGVLKQISGKDITVEIRAKSGGSNPATFSVECNFAGQSSCGRKRFRVGIQPEDIIFALNINKDVINGNSFLAINTDVASTADATGAGDVVDLVYARIRLSN